MTDKKDLQTFAKLTPITELKAFAEQMNASQAHEMIPYIDEKIDPDWKQKLETLIFSTENREVLEALSKAMSLEQLSFLTDHTFQTITPHHWKFSAIIMGLSFEMFGRLLFQASNRQLSLLQHESVTEPIQHQLTQICHDFERRLNVIEQDFDAFSLEITRINTQELERNDALNTFQKIDLFAKTLEVFLENSSKALTLAWKSGRSDLIKILNHIKDSCQKYLSYGIGTPRLEENLPTGLYAQLEKALFQKFNDPQALNDQDPAIEGLAKFSLWELKDYLQIGLVSSKKSQELLAVIDQTEDANERERLQELLFNEIKNNLEKRRLKTIMDLKRHVIFSKKSLYQYLNNP